MAHTQQGENGSIFRDTSILLSSSHSMSKTWSPITTPPDVLGRNSNVQSPSWHVWQVARMDLGSGEIGRRTKQTNTVEVADLISEGSRLKAGDRPAGESSRRPDRVWHYPLPCVCHKGGLLRIFERPRLPDSWGTCLASPFLFPVPENTGKSLLFITWLPPTGACRAMFTHACFLMSKLRPE